MALARMLRLEHIGELLHEIYDERAFVSIQPVQCICHISQLIVRPR